MALEPKTPGEEKDYGIDWSRYLEDGVTISTSTWRVPSGLTNEADDIDGQATVIRLSGGAVNQDYVLNNTIATSTGETLERSIQVKVRSAAVIAGA